MPKKTKPKSIQQILKEGGSLNNLQVSVLSIDGDTVVITDVNDKKNSARIERYHVKFDAEGFTLTGYLDVGGRYQKVAFPFGG